MVAHWHEHSTQLILLAVLSFSSLLMFNYQMQVHLYVFDFYYLMQRCHNSEPRL